MDTPAITKPSDHQVIILAAGRSLRLKRLTTDRPKSLLPVEGKPILGHGLGALSRRGFRQLTLVVGFLQDQFRQTFGERFEGIDIEYVVNEKYASSEHGFSLYCARHCWSRERRPVVFMDADNLFDPAMVDRVMGSGLENVMLVDDGLDTSRRDEELVLGRDGVVTGLRRGRVDGFEDCAGGFVGINRFSAEFMGTLFEYMDDFFAERGPMYKYERVFDAFIRERGRKVHYVETKGLPWINVNEESDYETAKRIARMMGEDG